MGAKGQNPADRVRDVQHFQSMELLEDGIDPDYAEQAGAGQGYKHGKQRSSDSSQGAYDDVHHAAEAISGADNAETQHTIGDHFRFSSVKPQQGITQQVSGIA